MIFWYIINTAAILYVNARFYGENAYHKIAQMHFIKKEWNQIKEIFHTRVRNETHLSDKFFGFYSKELGEIKKTRVETDEIKKMCGITEFSEVWATPDSILVCKNGGYLLKWDYRSYGDEYFYLKTK